MKVTSDEERMSERVARFEELIAWQKARALTRDSYRVSSNGAFGRDFGLRDQIRRASVSVMSNIAEGHERSNPGDFHRFLSIAKASNGEVRSQLYIALDVGYLDSVEFQRLMELAEEVGRIVGGLRTAVASKREASAG
jgi:four helix bundle protein